MIFLVIVNPTLRTPHSRLTLRREKVYLQPQLPGHVFSKVRHKSIQSFATHEPDHPSSHRDKQDTVKVIPPTGGVVGGERQDTSDALSRCLNQPHTSVAPDHKIEDDAGRRAKKKKKKIFQMKNPPSLARRGFPAARFAIRPDPELQMNSRAVRGKNFQDGLIHPHLEYPTEHEIETNPASVSRRGFLPPQQQIGIVRL